jgi:hypothetical protein
MYAPKTHNAMPIRWKKVNSKYTQFKITSAVVVNKTQIAVACQTVCLSIKCHQEYKVI